MPVQKCDRRLTFLRANLGLTSAIVMLETRDSDSTGSGGSEMCP